MEINLRTVRTAPHRALPRILGELAYLTAIATARNARPPSRSATVEPEGDTLLCAEDAAKRCGLTVKALLRKRDHPARRKLGPRTIRWSSRAIAKYLRSRAA